MAQRLGSCTGTVTLRDGRRVGTVWFRCSRPTSRLGSLHEGGGARVYIASRISLDATRLSCCTCIDTGPHAGLRGPEARRARWRVHARVFCRGDSASKPVTSRPPNVTRALALDLKDSPQPFSRRCALRRALPCAPKTCRTVAPTASSWTPHSSVCWCRSGSRGRRRTRRTSTRARAA